jgi:hypothetical protein
MYKIETFWKTVRDVNYQNIQFNKINTYNYL